MIGSIIGAIGSSVAKNVVKNAQDKKKETSNSNYT